ncbi:MAG: NADH-quinone oxidoreductase subunit N [Gemmatimonadota bacterium]|nr:NADH-quinone oxidoreductase subunit N [Gemmatimonadota bacterium]
MTFDLATPLGLTMALGPDLVVAVGAMFLLIWAAWRADSASHQRAVGGAGIVVALLGLAASIYYLLRGFTATDGPIAVDNFRWMMNAIILVGTIAAIALGMDDNERQEVHVAESHVLLLLGSSGMMLLAAARDLIIVFLGVELMSVAVYALAGMNRRSARSAEGALKYFLLGAFSSAFLLYGIALIYGATATVELAEIGRRIAEPSLGIPSSPLLVAGAALLLVGFAFKVSAVPFHMWAPDVYDGAPTAVTAYMAATVKAAAFAAFFRVWLEAFPDTFETWRPAIALLAVTTMVIGNAVGLVQRNVKRLLAYSSIGHAGYLLVALAADTPEASTAIVFYLLIYTLATFGAFAVVSALTRRGEGTVTLDEMAGLWHERPWLATAIAVFMLALLGFPIFGGAGFFAKYYVVQAALDAPRPQTALAIVLMLTTVVSAGYYLYVVMVMFMRPRPEGAVGTSSAAGFTRGVIAAAAVLILILGVAPDLAVRAARVATPRVGAPASAVSAAAAQGPTTAR